MFRELFERSTVLLVFVAVAATPAKADAFFFSTPSFLLDTGSGGGAIPNLSQLALVDTPAGFGLHGIISLTMPNSGSLTSGFLVIRTARFFDAPFDTPALLTAHMDGSFSTTGDITITEIATATTLFPTPPGFGPCAASVIIGTGQLDSAIAPGVFGASFSGNNVNPANPCHAVGDLTNQNELVQDFSIALFTNGAGGTATFNFGNSIDSAVTPVAAAVPEPSTLPLLGVGVLICVLRRFRVSNSTAGHF